MEKRVIARIDLPADLERTFNAYLTEFMRIYSYDRYMSWSIAPPKPVEITEPA
jgi:hypothetical protein